MVATVTSAVRPAEGTFVLIVVLLGVLAWLVVAFLAAVVMGRSVRLADARTPGTGVETVLTTEALAPAV